jgi:hypothetical protein
MDYSPSLIEYNVSNYLENSLKMSHLNRIQIYSFALNTTIVLVFGIIFGSFLYYRYQNKPSAYDRQQKLYRDQEYILSKIRFYQNEQKNLMTSPIGNL